MRRHFLSFVVVVLSLFVSSQRAQALTLDDITFYVGSGSNRAGMVIDWADGRDPLIWGYRWDGAATGEDMFRDIAMADPRLFAKISDQFAFGDFIFGIGYDRDDDGFGISDATVFTDGLFVGPATDGATATDADDSYVEGFNTGFFGYFVASGSPYDGGSWGFAPVGISDRVLSDGDFDGFAFAPGFNGGEPALPVPATGGSAGGNNGVPEPTTFMFGCVAIAVVGMRRKRAI